MTPYQVSSEIYGGFFYSGITLSMAGTVSDIYAHNYGAR